jgi:hypothetical protein
MSFSFDNELELQDEGGADWDAALRSNFQIQERGFHLKGTAGAGISSGQICLMNSAGFIMPYDSRSLSLRWPHCMAYKNVSSGAEAIFVREGIVRSMAVWSGKLTRGEPVFVAPNSLGFAVSSYPAAAYPAGIALGVDAVYFCPGRDIFPETVTEAQTLANVLMGAASASNFAFSLANKGNVRQLRVVAQSCNAYRVEWWSGSARVGSEQLYATLTLSNALGNSVDVTTLNYLDQAGFPWFNTDTASPALVFGRVTVQSGSQVSSSHFAVTAVVERFR